MCPCVLTYFATTVSKTIILWSLAIHLYFDLGLYLKMFLEVSAVLASDVTSGPFAGACTQWVYRVHSLRTVYPTTLDIKMKKTENGGKGHVTYM
jgi:hypothetical protein